MKIVLSLAAVLALAVGLNLSAVDPASAGCFGWRCGGVVVVPAPVPIPMRPGASYYYAPGAYYYAPGAYYAYWAQPAYYSGCYAGPGNCYWRRDCWYDSFGRRFCN